MEVDYQGNRNLLELARKAAVQKFIVVSVFKADRMKNLADTYPGLFKDMLHLFNGKQVENHSSSDIALVLHPLPMLPILSSYWKPEDELESSLNLFFDSTAEQNLNIKSIYALASGLVMMFEKIALTYGNDQ